jgi:hypothetical protein
LLLIRFRRYYLVPGKRHRVGPDGAKKIIIFAIKFNAVDISQCMRACLPSPSRRRAEWRVHFQREQDRMFWLRRAVALLQVFRAGSSTAGLRASRMQARSRGASAATRRITAPRSTISDISRRRRGWLATLNCVWRRRAVGTNHISAFGVWRPGTRRARLRVNRDGQTRWQRPFPRLGRATAGAGSRQFDNGDIS